MASQCRSKKPSTTKLHPMCTWSVCLKTLPKMCRRARRRSSRPNSTSLSARSLRALSTQPGRISVRMVSRRSKQRQRVRLLVPLLVHLPRGEETMMGWTTIPMPCRDVCTNGCLPLSLHPVITQTRVIDYQGRNCQLIMRGVTYSQVVLGGASGHVDAAVLYKDTYVTLVACGGMQYCRACTVFPRRGDWRLPFCSIDKHQRFAVSLHWQTSNARHLALLSNNRGSRAAVLKSVISFSRLNKPCLGCFDQLNVIFDEE